MPEPRLQRTRATLRDGYQFGDAGPRPSWRPLRYGPKWLQREMVGIIPGWNVIEAEEHSDDHLGAVGGE